jgi:predicted methyltransferase
MSFTATEIVTNFTTKPNSIDILLSCYLHDEKDRDSIVIPQLEHRIELIKQWDIKPGAQILELGGGQGDCTVVLADAVGQSGHVTAVDPGALEYGKHLTENSNYKSLILGTAD